MSYNINHCEYLKGELTIKRRVAALFAAQYKTDLPEDNFLDDLEDLNTGDGEDLLPITRFTWRGVFSGNAYEEILRPILAKTQGHADILFIWEGGDSMTGLRVRDGKVRKMKVNIILMEK